MTTIWDLARALPNPIDSFGFPFDLKAPFSNELRFYLSRFPASGNKEIIHIHENQLHRQSLGPCSAVLELNLLQEVPVF